MDCNRSLRTCSRPARPRSIFCGRTPPADVVSNPTCINFTFFRPFLQWLLIFNGIGVFCFIFHPEKIAGNPEPEKGHDTSAWPAIPDNT